MITSTITTIEAIGYNWFEWPNIISFFVVIAGLTLMFIALGLALKERFKATTVLIVGGALVAIAGMVWGIADEANTEVVYQRVIYQVVDKPG